VLVWSLLAKRPVMVHVMEHSAKCILERLKREQQHEHPDRMRWYRFLIGEWTGHTPHVMTVDGTAVAWVQAYGSAPDIPHRPVAVCAVTCERALEGLANAVYRAVQAQLEEVVL
jgi:hypothetical protein